MSWQTILADPPWDPSSPGDQVSQSRKLLLGASHTPLAAPSSSLVYSWILFGWIRTQQWGTGSLLPSGSPIDSFFTHTHISCHIFYLMKLRSIFVESPVHAPSERLCTISEQEYEFFPYGWEYYEDYKWIPYGDIPGSFTWDFKGLRLKCG